MCLKVVEFGLATDLVLAPQKHKWWLTAVPLSQSILVAVNSPRKHCSCYKLSYFNKNPDSIWLRLYPARFLIPAAFSHRKQKINKHVFQQ